MPHSPGFYKKILDLTEKALANSSQASMMTKNGATTLIIMTFSIIALSIIINKSDAQYNGSILLCLVSFMPSVTNAECHI
jgi:hypothetical protein